MKDNAITAFCVLLLAAIIFSGCIASQQNGILQGHISIGPICPVERNPPDPDCQPTEQTYLAYPLGVYNAGIKVAEFHGDAQGNYSIALPPSAYEIRQETGLRQFTQTAQISAGITTTLDIDIDTGIR